MRLTGKNIITVKGVICEVVTLQMQTLKGENLEEVISGYIKGVPISLPKGWALVDGVLVSKKKTK